MEAGHCPTCGRMPLLMPNLLGKLYAACPGHHETLPAPTRQEAIARWNAGEFEHPLAGPSHGGLEFEAGAESTSE